MRKIGYLFLTFGLGLSLGTNELHGIHGYFLEGDGIRSLGMGGTAVANPQESLVISSNPSGISFLEDRVDVGISWLDPERCYTYTLPVKTKTISQRTDYLIPNFGAIKHLSDCDSLGISLTARGLGSSYPNDNPVFGNGKLDQVLGLDYLHMVIAPTYSRKLSDEWALGVSLICGAQRISVKGLQGFTAFSSAPHHLTNNGYSYAGGIGAQIGLMGQVTSRIKVGLSYASKVFMSKFNKYKGLLAQHGRLDVPSQLFAGLSWNATDALLFAIDYQRIFYGEVDSLHHSVSKVAPGNLGTNKGAGFGWKDVNVYKFGVNYYVNCCWELRAGYSYGDKPYNSSQIDFNLLIPAISQHHITVGGTYHVNCSSQVNIFYGRTISTTTKGQSKLGLGKMSETLFVNQVGMSFSYLY